MSKLHAIVAVIPAKITKVNGREEYDGGLYECQSDHCDFQGPLPASINHAVANQPNLISAPVASTPTVVRLGR